MNILNRVRRSDNKRSIGFCILLLTLLAAAGCEAPPVESAETGVSLSVPFETRVWDSPMTEGQEIVTEDYRIYTTVKKNNLLAVLPGFLQAARGNAEELTGLRGSNEPAPAYLLADRNEWDLLTRKIFPSVRNPADLLENGGYCRDGVVVCWDIGKQATLAIVAHEAMHQFLHGRIKSPLPLWVNEGLAVANEGYEIRSPNVMFNPDKNSMRMIDLRAAIVRKQWIPLPALLTASPRSLLAAGTGRGVQYYAQLYALMSFIRSNPGTAQGLQRLLKDAAAGDLTAPVQNGENVNIAIFRHYIAADLHAYERALLAHAKKLTMLE